MDTNEAVKELYELFPYPEAEEDLSDLVAGKKCPSWNPRDSAFLYFPNRPREEALEVLIAGCGTNTAQQHAAYLPKMNFVAIDISTHSLDHAKRIAAKYNLKNIEFHQLPIERAGELNRQFDYVSCHGVLHHMEDPVRGLSALAQVTKPTGALSIMLYGKYGRTGIYMLQELFRDRLGLRVTREDVVKIRAALQGLQEDHPFRTIHKNRAQAISLEEIADMILHPRDRAYAVQDVRELVERAGLQFQRWLGQAHYDPEASPLANLGLWNQSERPEQADAWARAAAMELYYGTIIKHEFALTHRGNKTPHELFSDDGIRRAVPTLSAHLEVKDLGDRVLLTNQRHQMVYEVHISKRSDLGLLKMMDGQRRSLEVVRDARREKLTDLEIAPGIEIIRALHRADMVDLHLPA